jgi:6-phospho-beta-glucosidase
LNVMNGDTLSFLPADASIEVNCVVTKNGAIPVQVERVPDAAVGLIQAVKTYESLAIEAAVTGSREKALLALSAHPLTDSVGIAEAMLDEMLEQNRKYLPQFFQGVQSARTVIL